MKITNTRVIGICIIVASSFLVAGVSQADSTTFNACVKKSNGATRIISGRMRCHWNEHLVSWTSTSDLIAESLGVPGPKGDTGARGPQGLRGLPGINGIDGVNGVNGIDGVDGVNGKDGSDGLPGAAGANGSNGRDGTNGTNGSDGTPGTNGVDGAAGATGAAGINGTNGVNGISKALIASGSQISIYQGTSATVLTANVPAGKYAMSLAAGLSFNNVSTTMLGYAAVDCILTSSSTYIAALSIAASDYWPVLGTAGTNRTTFGVVEPTGDEAWRQSFAGNTTLNLASSTTLRLICKHYSSVTDEPAQKVTFWNPRLILTAVDEIATL